MRASHIILLFFIFATVGIHFVRQITGPSAPDPLVLIQARRSLRALEDLHQTIENKVNGKMKRSMKQASSVATEYDGISNEDPELVYNIDYHGVTTHPNPTPKHP